MRSRYAVFLTAAALLGLGGSALADDPVSAARNMIEASKTLVDGVPGGHVYTDRLMAIWEAIPEEQRSEFLTDSDLQEPNFMVRMTGEATAEVDVALWRQGDTPLNITLDLQKVGENWLIDEIRAPDMPQPFSELLQQVADASAGTGN